MTGAYLRVKRNGNFENVEVENLTNKERVEKFGESESTMWLNLVCNKLSALEPLLKELEQEGIIGIK